MSIVYIVGGLILGLGTLLLSAAEIYAVRGPGETITATVRRLPPRWKTTVVAGCGLIAAGAVTLALHFAGLF